MKTVLFADYSRFQKRENSSKVSKDKYCSIKFKDGTIFKQVTVFEEVASFPGEKGKGTSGYGAWFASDKDAIFLTAEIISELLDESKAVFIKEDTYN